MLDRSTLAWIGQSAFKLIFCQAFFKLFERVNTQYLSVVEHM